MMRLFKDEEYVSEVLSRIYEIRYETLEQENVQGKFVWLVDITEHYKTNKKLKELKEMADAANKAKSNFLANMSHEIRTPINTVLGMDEIILREATEVPIKGMRKTSVKPVRRFCHWSTIFWISPRLNVARWKYCRWNMK